jgi:hypothetical protein
VKEFGPCDDWTRNNSPGRGLDHHFEQFCEAFAKAVGAESGEAVKHQIRFAMPESGRVTWEDGHAQSAIMNKAAALETGFIENRHLPDLQTVVTTPSLESL